jgi:hypothetical protein
MTDDDERARPNLRLAASNGQQLGLPEWRRRPVEDEDLIAALADVLATGPAGTRPSRSRLRCSPGRSSRGNSLKPGQKVSSPISRADCQGTTKPDPLRVY